MQHVMKIAFFGNQGNKNYRLCRFMREIGHAGELYFMPDSEGHLADPFQHMESKSQYEDWIHPISSDEQIPEVLKRIAAGYDAIVATGRHAMGCLDPLMTTEVPLILAPTGPANLGMKESTPADEDWLRKLVGRADIVMTAHPVIMNGLDKIGLGDKARFFLPGEDIETRPRLVSPELRQGLADKFGRFHRLYCWFSRSIFDPQSEGYKGAEIFLAGAHRFVTENPQLNVRFLFGAHGRDAEAAVDVIEFYGLKSVTDVLGELPFEDLLAYLSLTNGILFDNVAQSTLTSGIMRDALSLGMPVARNMPSALTATALAPNCPVVSVDSADRVAAAMADFYHMDDGDLGALRARSTEWAQAAFGWPARIEKFENLISEVLIVRSLKNRGAQLAGNDLWQACELRRRGDLEAAVARFQAFIEHHPFVPRARYELERTLCDLNCHEEALRAVCQGLELFPRDPKLLYRAGVISETLRDNEAALEWYERALARPRSPFRAYLKASRLLSAKGQTERALTLLAEAREKFPDQEVLAREHLRIQTLR